MRQIINKNIGSLVKAAKAIVVNVNFVALHDGSCPLVDFGAKKEVCVYGRRN